MKKKVFIFAGEPSGDLHGAQLMQGMQNGGQNSTQKADYEFFGVGGPKMRSEGLNTLIPMESFCVMGIGAVILALPRLVRHFFKVARSILELQPAGVILIDYPGFNLRLMRYLRKRGYRGHITQYIAPSVWAHGKGRADILAQHADLLLVIFPFEKAHFPNCNVHYVSHSLLKITPSKEPHKNLIALFPGSRSHEIKDNLPALVAVAQRLQKDHPTLKIAISAAHPRAAEWIKKQAPYHCVRFDTEELMDEARLALAVSGTVTLELALKERPTLVCYRIPRLMYWAARWIARVKLEHFCIVNIILGKRLFPEFYETKLSVDAMTKAAKELLERELDFATLREALGRGESAPALIAQSLEAGFARETRLRPR